MSLAKYSSIIITQFYKKKWEQHSLKNAKFQHFYSGVTQIDVNSSVGKDESILNSQKLRHSLSCDHKLALESASQLRRGQVW